jgi:hypothetical protein
MFHFIPRFCTNSRMSTPFSRFIINNNLFPFTFNCIPQTNLKNNDPRTLYLPRGSVACVRVWFCICVRYGIYLVKPSVQFGKNLIFPCLLIVILPKSLILFQVLYCLVMETYRCYYCDNGYENFEKAVLHGS